jgi:protein-tyrosine phosphatase
MRWPDHGCPEDPLDLINFVKYIQSERRRLNSNSPVIVHCSAGVGRTGTFITMDILLKMIEYNGVINIYEIVKNLRTERVKMVQSECQYLFLYDCAFRLAKKLSVEGRIQTTEL